MSHAIKVIDGHTVTITGPDAQATADKLSAALSPSTTTTAMQHTPEALQLAKAAKVSRDQSTPLDPKMLQRMEAELWRLHSIESNYEAMPARFRRIFWGGFLAGFFGLVAIIGAASIFNAIITFFA